MQTMFAVLVATCLGFAATQAVADVGSPEHGPREGYSGGETKAGGEARAQATIDRLEKEHQEAARKEAARQARERELKVRECEMKEATLNIGRGRDLPPIDLDCEKLRKFSVEEIKSDRVLKYRKKLSKELEEADRASLRTKLEELNKLDLKVALESIDRPTLRNAVAVIDRDTYRAGLSVVDKSTAALMKKYR